MPTYIAILRGINVSGVRKLPMKELKVIFVELKCTNVRTYIQSGNVVFEHAKLDPSEFARSVEQKIKKQYGYDVPVLIRTATEMTKAFTSNP